MIPEGDAIVLCADGFQSDNGKTAHGLIRSSERYRIAAVIDGPGAGRDAGTLLDGKPRGIAIFASVAEALAALAERPRFAIVGIATSGGRISPDLRAEIAGAIDAGLSIVNGLHELVADDPALAAAARERGIELVDVRRPKRTSDLHFWTGAIRDVHAPRVAVLGTDCAVGKRTTARLLTEGCRAAGMNAEMIYTGQTGWLQGGRFGFILDATPNDFVSGELEHAIVSCASETFPDVIFLEGQSALRNPSGPCGSELILSAGARAVILQHAPARREFEGLEGMGYAIPPPEDEIELISRYGARTIGLALSTHGLAEPGRVREELERRLGIPVACPLETGVATLVAAVRAFVRHSSAA